MKRRSIYLTWIVVGVGLGAATVSVLAVIYMVGGPVVDGTVSSDDAQYAAIALIIGACYGAFGGAIAGLGCAVVSHALAARDVDSAPVQGVIAACVVASIATPAWALMWSTDSSAAFFWQIVLPLAIAILTAFAGGLLVGRLCSGRSTSVVS